MTVLETGLIGGGANGAGIFDANIKLSCLSYMLDVLIFNVINYKSN